MGRCGDLPEEEPDMGSRARLGGGGSGSGGGCLARYSRAACVVPQITFSRETTAAFCSEPTLDVGLRQTAMVQDATVA